MMIEIPLAEHSRIQDFLPFGLQSPRFLTNAVTLDPFSRTGQSYFLNMFLLWSLWPIIGKQSNLGMCMAGMAKGRRRAHNARKLSITSLELISLQRVKVIGDMPGREETNGSL
jgi:hypothetical protein